MIREATISGFRMTGKTEAMLDMSCAKAQAGFKVLYVTSNWNGANHTYDRASRAFWREDGVVVRSTPGSQHITFPSGGEIRFVSQRSEGLHHFNAAVVVLDDLTYYDHPERTLEAITVASEGAFWLYKVETVE